MRVLAVQEVNLAQRKHAVNSIRKVLGPLDPGRSPSGVPASRAAARTCAVARHRRHLLLRNEGAMVKIMTRR
jgi:hypothetical protein